MDSFAFFMPGPIELLIIGLVCLAPLAALIVIAVVLARSKKTGSDAAANPNLFPCPDCGRMVSQQAPACPQCGRPLLPPGQS